jgi:DNA-binding MarR family transcriptional regulator
MLTDLELLGQAVKRAQWRNHRAMDTALQEVGVSLVQWDALRAIDRMPGASSHALAVATFQSDQAFGKLAQRLLARGLVERGTGRGRRLEHTLTASGSRALADGRDVASRVLDELFAPLDESERATLATMLETLVAEDRG